MTADLKSCPFCGCKVSLEKGPTVYSIACVKGSSCIGSGLLIGFMHDKLESAVVQWNTRAYPPQAAIAAAMMGAVKPLEWCDLHKDGCTFVPREGFIPFHFSATISLRHSGAWHFAGNLFPTPEAAKAAAEADWQARNAAIRVIPTDAMAALEAVKVQAEQRGFERAKEQAAQIVGSWLAGNIRRDIEDEIRDMKGGAA